MIEYFKKLSAKKQLAWGVLFVVWLFLLVICWPMAVGILVLVAVIAAVTVLTV